MRVMWVELVLFDSYVIDNVSLPCWAEAKSRTYLIVFIIHIVNAFFKKKKNHVYSVFLSVLMNNALFFVCMVVMVVK